LLIQGLLKYIVTEIKLPKPKVEEGHIIVVVVINAHIIASYFVDILVDANKASFMDIGSIMASGNFIRRGIIVISTRDFKSLTISNHY
jgi:hypothetical protein